MFKTTIILSFLAGFVVKCDDNKYYIVEVSKETDRIRRPFYIYWNVPTMQCKSKGIHFAGLYEKFGIIQNSEDQFLGDKMAILYDPGLFPALFKNETDGRIRYRNGGVPQEGNLTKHIEAFEKSVLRSIPDEHFDGIAVIDFESWRPIYKQNYGVLTPYKDISYDIERKRHPWWIDQWVKHEAERRFEEAGRSFMEATLIKAKQLRSKARWGYYGFPYCFNSDHRDSCSKDTMQENDRCRWLWSNSDALFPSVYSSKSVKAEQLKAVIKGRVKEAARLVEKNAGILPYVWFRQRDGDYFDEKDLKAIFSTIYNTEGSSGVIIWGSSSDVNTKTKCENLYKYIYNKFGPLVSKYAKYDNREENKVTYGDNLVTDTNTADSNTNIVIETTTVKNNDVELVFNLQEGPEGTIHVVQPIEAINNRGFETSNIGEAKPIEGSNVTGGQIVSNPNKPNSEAVVMFQQLNGLTIIDLLHKMFGKTVQFANGTSNLGDSLQKPEGKADIFAQDANEGGILVVNDEIDIKDIFDINSDEHHVITTEQSVDYNFNTQNSEYEFTTQLIEDIGAIEKGFHFIDNVQDVFQNMHKKFEKPSPNYEIETSTKIQITNTELKDSIIALKEVFSELKKKNLTSEPGDLFSFLDTDDEAVQVISSTTETPETFDVLKVITEPSDIYFNEIPQNSPTEEIITPFGSDLEMTTEYNNEYVKMFIPIKESIIKTNKNKIFNENFFNDDLTTTENNQDRIQDIDTKQIETTESTPYEDSLSTVYKNIEEKLVSTTMDDIQSTTSQYLDFNHDNIIGISNKILSTTEKNENLLSDSTSTTTLNKQETTTEKEFTEFGDMLMPIKDSGDVANNEQISTTPKETSTGVEFSELGNTNTQMTIKDSGNLENSDMTTTEVINTEIGVSELSNMLLAIKDAGNQENGDMTTPKVINTEIGVSQFSNILIPIKDPSDIASNDNTTPTEKEMNFASTTSFNNQAVTDSRAKAYEARKRNFFKRLSRKKHKEIKRLIHRMKTNNYHTTDRNNIMQNTRKDNKDINFLIYRSGKYNFQSTTSQYLGVRRDDTKLAIDKPIAEKEKKKKYIFSDLILNNNEDFNWLSNNYMPQGIATASTETDYQETTTYKQQWYTNVPGSAEDDVIINNFLNEYDTAAGRPLADLMTDIAIKSEETLAKDPEFTEVLSKEIKKLTEQGYSLNLNDKPFLYDAARKDLAVGFNKSNHFLYPEKNFISAESTTITDQNTDILNNAYYDTNDPINIYNNNGIAKKSTRQARTLKDLLLLHNASYPHSFRDQKADKSIEYILNNEVDINLEEEKDVKRDVVYDKRELKSNFNRTNASLTTALDLEKHYISDASNSCNQHKYILTLVFTYSILSCLNQL